MICFFISDQKKQSKIKFIKKILKGFEELTHVGEVRQCGFMVGIELVKDKESKEPYGWDERIGVKVCNQARKMGMIIRPLDNIIVFMPPLSSTKKELSEMLNIIYQSIVKVTNM